MTTTTNNPYGGGGATPTPIPDVLPASWAHIDTLACPAAPVRCVLADLIKRADHSGHYGCCDALTALLDRTPDHNPYLQAVR